MGVNSLPKTVSQQRRGCDLNPGPSVPESSTLSTRLPSHHAAMRAKTATTASAAGVGHGLLELLMRSRDWRSVKWGHWDTAAAIARYAHDVRYGTVESGSIHPPPEHLPRTVLYNFNQRYLAMKVTSFFSFS